MHNMYDMSITMDYTAMYIVIVQDTKYSFKQINVIPVRAITPRGRTNADYAIFKYPYISPTYPYRIYPPYRSQTIHESTITMSSLLD